jgi:hypothetical protein
MYSNQTNWNNILVSEEQKFERMNKNLATAKQIMNMFRTNWKQKQVQEEK